MAIADYIPILVMVVMAGFLVVFFWLASEFLGPYQRGGVTKQMPFECGHPSEGFRPKRFAVKFYGIAVLFILFDIEAVFLYPWAVVLNELKLFALVGMIVFIVILFVALGYVWAKGGLEWD
jgi:NADH-quinone oxidoreductase subunit A